MEYPNWPSRLVDQDDVDTDGLDDGDGLVWDETAGMWVPGAPSNGGGGGGGSEFIDLDDTPGDYTGQGGKAVAVTGGEDGVEFVDFPSGSGASPVTSQDWVDGEGKTWRVMMGTDGAFVSELIAEPPEIADEFDRPDEPLADSDDWHTASGTAEVENEQLRLKTGRVIHQTQVSETDHFAEYIYGDPGSGSCGPVVRNDSNTSLANGYHGRFSGSPLRLELYRMDSGSLTLLDDTPASPSEGDVLRVEAEGDTIRVLVNGVEELSVTDSSHSLGRYVGIREGRNENVRIDSFAASRLM